MRKVESFEELKSEFENYLRKGVDNKRLIVYFTDDGRRELSLYYGNRVIDKPPVEYLQRIVRNGRLLIPKDKRLIIGGDKTPKREGSTRLYAVCPDRYAYFDVYDYNEAKILNSKDVRLKKVISKLPIMPLREYFSNMREIWNLEGKMDVRVRTFLSEYMGLGDSSKMLPLIQTMQFELWGNFDDVIFQ